MTDEERYVMDELKGKTMAQKKSMYKKMDKEAKIGATYFGHNSYWAELYNALFCELERAGKISMYD